MRYFTFLDSYFVGSHDTLVELKPEETKNKPFFFQILNILKYENKKNNPIEIRAYKKGLYQFKYRYRFLTKYMYVFISKASSNIFCSETGDDIILLLELGADPEKVEKDYAYF